MNVLQSGRATQTKEIVANLKLGIRIVNNYIHSTPVEQWSEV